MPSDLALAVDLGGTKVEAALVDSGGRIIDGSRFRRPTGASSDSEQLSGSVTGVVAAALGTLPTGSGLLGIGIGAAGPIRQDDGLVSPLNLPAWRDFPLTELVATTAPGHEITLRMDGLCITLAEHWVGAGRDSSNHMGMVVSTGIGGGLILGGRTVSGPTGNAGHIGHVEVAGFTDDCACGGHGCLEAVASGPRSVAWARAQGWSGSTGEELAESHVAGDGIAQAAVARAGRAIGRAIGSVTSLVDLELVTIGGGFSRITPELFDHIRAGIDEHTSFGFVRKVSVVPSALSDEGPLIGAAALVHRADILD
ncbi:glucokinase [Cryobacterium mesophilum]|uniref:ROK family protein n=1 Tax=Terrimesophilobacter mesophilus TaxID=433647 RepID=A0A4R8V8P7_9MICO|nr:ROK family protein [Terrimesophilobacter mesophilus]MBB5634077.1 glucokinase [Terrimesophilobacter mesophilus]TFB78666.1 ROK family protein [Terrimesophilobacter mesophilus]